FVRMPLVVDSKRRHAPTPHDSTRAKSRDWPLKLRACQTFDVPRDLSVKVRGGGRIAFGEVGDRLYDVGDCLFGVGDLQRPRAASMIWRARFASTTRPCRYDSSAASMPASSSGDKTGASSSTGSTT